MVKGSRKEDKKRLVAYKLPADMIADLKLMAESIYKTTGYKVSSAAIVRKAISTILDAWKAEGK